MGYSIPEGAKSRMRTRNLPSVSPRPSAHSHMPGADRIQHVGLTLAFQRGSPVFISLAHPTLLFQRPDVILIQPVF